MNIKHLGVIGGLVALLGTGCVDKTEIIEEFKCQVSETVDAKIIYHRLPLGIDYRTVVFENEHGKVLGEINCKEFYNSRINCSDGKTVTLPDYASKKMIIY